VVLSNMLHLGNNAVQFIDDTGWGILPLESID